MAEFERRPVASMVTISVADPASPGTELRMYPVKVHHPARRLRVPSQMENNAMAKRKRWSYNAGERGRNWVRAYCGGCPDQPTCRREEEHTGNLYLEWYEQVYDPDIGPTRHRSADW